jgi:hypothetical protein
VFLSRGRADLEAAAVPVPVVVYTPHGEISAAAAVRAAISVSASGTRLQVREGRARLSSNRGGNPTDVDAGRFALLGEGGDTITTRGWGEVVLVVGAAEGPLGPDGVNTADGRVKQRLEGLGLRVRVETAIAGPTPDFEGVLLVAISSSINGKVFEWDLRRVRVPVLAWEPAIFPPLAMVQNKAKEQGSLLGVDRIVIKDSTHPLAAGFHGTVQVTGAAADLTWGAPGLWASWVASAPGDPTKATLFAYERGAKMPGGIAPARRVGFFLHDQIATTLTSDGWSLFDAAVRWCIAAE